MEGTTEVSPYDELAQEQRARMTWTKIIRADGTVERVREDKLDARIREIREERKR